MHKSEISELRIRFADEAALHKRINEHMALMVVLFAEIESLRQRVKDKEKEVEDVRRSSLRLLKSDHIFYYYLILVDNMLSIYRKSIIKGSS